MTCLVLFLPVMGLMMVDFAEVRFGNGFVELDFVIVGCAAVYAVAVDFDAYEAVALHAQYGRLIFSGSGAAVEESASSAFGPPDTIANLIVMPLEEVG